MTGTLIVAAQEMRERSFVFVTSLIAAIMPFVVVLSPNPGSDPREAIIRVVGGQQLDVVAVREELARERLDMPSHAPRIGERIR